MAVALTALIAVAIAMVPASDATIDFDELRRESKVGDRPKKP